MFSDSFLIQNHIGLFSPKSDIGHDGEEERSRNHGASSCQTKVKHTAMKTEVGKATWKEKAVIWD